MWRKIPLALIGCAVLGFFVGCAKKVPPTSGRLLLRNAYTNDFFRFQITIPAGWSVADREALQKATKAGAKALTSGDKQAEAAMEASLETTHQLLVVSEKPLGTRVEPNRSIVLTAEDISGAPAVKNGKDYITESMKLLTGPGKALRPMGEPVPVRINGREFYRADIEGDVLGRKIRQAYFVLIDKRHALSIVITADSESNVNQVLASIGFPQHRR
jgi:hypothetical protein